MPNRIIFLCTICVIYGCQSYRFQSMDDLLVGTWRESEYLQGGFYFEEIAYTRDGEKCTLGLGVSEEYGIEVYAFVSEWEIDGEVLRLKIVRTSSEYLEVGEILKLDILNLTNSKMAYKPKGEKGPIDQYYKISSQPNMTICELVRKWTST